MKWCSIKLKIVGLLTIMGGLCPLVPNISLLKYLPKMKKILLADDNKYFIINYATSNWKRDLWSYIPGGSFGTIVPFKSNMITERHQGSLNIVSNTLLNITEIIVCVSVKLTSSFWGLIRINNSILIQTREVSLIFFIKRSINW